MMQLNQSTIQPKKGHQLDKYSGEIHPESKLRHGNGSYRYNNSFFGYEGEYCDGIKEGKGILRLKDGRVIDGHFQNNELNGSASIAYPDGSTYVGQLFLGQKSGKGSMNSPYQSYQGQWKNNCRHGQGIYRNHALGHLLQGQFYQNHPHGYCQEHKYNYSFQGNYHHGHKNGKGTEINLWSKNNQNDGQMPSYGQYKYEGFFEDDKFSGEGTYTSKETSYVYEGIFKNGLPQIYPNQFKISISTNTISGENIIENQKISIGSNQPLEYQLEGDSFNLYIQTAYQGPQILDQIQPTQQEIDNLVKNWQNQNKKNKNPPPMPDFNQPKMKKPDTLVIQNQNGRQIVMKLMKQSSESKAQWLKIDYRGEIIERKRENEVLRQEGLKKAEEEGNKKGGKKDLKGESELKVNLFKEKCSEKQKQIKLTTQKGKTALLKFEFPDDFPPGKYFLILHSTFQDFGVLKQLKKEFNIKAKQVAKKK